MMYTYIIKTSSNEFYCGKSNNLPSRLAQHKKEKYPHWFANKKRKLFVDIIIFKGDHEKQIKRANSSVVYNLIKHIMYIEPYDKTKMIDIKN